MKAYYGPMQMEKSYKEKLDKNFLTYFPYHYNRRSRIYLHWSAGPYRLDFDDYHKNILGPDGKTIIQTYPHTPHVDPFTVVRAHTYHRNSDAIGVGLSCMTGATTNDYGENPLTPEMIDACIELLRNLCNNYRVPPHNIMSHAEAGDNKDNPEPLPHEPYGPESTCERWDLWCYYNPVKRHLMTAKIGKGGVTAPAPEGYLYLPDYIRGEVILKIQDDTRKYWDPAFGKGL